MCFVSNQLVCEAKNAACSDFFKSSNGGRGSIEALVGAAASIEVEDLACQNLVGVFTRLGIINARGSSRGSEPIVWSGIVHKRLPAKVCVLIVPRVPKPNPTNSIALGRGEDNELVRTISVDVFGLMDVSS